MGDEVVPVTRAASELNLSRWRVWQIIKVGDLPAEKVGDRWLIRRQDLDAFKRIERPKPGPKGPRKEQG